MTFLYPLFFLGLAALALPWILHQFNRETPPESPFPSTRFLEATRVPVSRKKRLRHLGLWSLRSLFLLFACLLFAQPYCSTDSNRAGAQSHTFLVLDRSASMQTGDRWSNAVAKTADLLSDGRASQLSDAAQNSAQLFDLTSQLTAHGELSTDLTEANAALRTLQPSFEKAQYGLMMQQLDALASKEDLPVDVVFITDAQNTNLPLQRRLLRTQHIRNFSIEAIRAQETNVAVQGSASSIDGVNVQMSVQILYSQTESGANPNDRNVNLEVRAGDQILSSKPVNAILNQPVTVVLDDLILPSAEVDYLTARVFADDGDDLSIDSLVDVPLRSVQPIVVGMRAFNMKMPPDASLFLRTALTTDALARVLSLSGNEENTLTQHWVVFLPQRQNESVTLPQEVVDFVTAGGNVMVVLQPIADDTVTAVGGEASDYIGSVDAAHPLALGEMNWQEARIYTSMPLKIDGSDRVLMRTGNGLPFLIERSLTTSSNSDGRASGRLLLVADPLDGVASDLPLQSAFVEWITQTVQWFDASSAFPTQLDVGDSIAVPANTQVLSPAGRSLRSLSESSTAGRLFFTEPGIHSVVTGSSEHQVAVTVPWEESNLAVIDDEFKQAWTRGELPDLAQLDEASGETNDTESDNPSRSELDASVLESEQVTHQPWWPWLLPLIALTFVAESLLANRRLAVRRDGL